jgi:serine/threonine-protein kinase
MPLVTGSRLGPYEILAPLGTGGMGVVYQARDPRLDRLVAIKVLPPDLTRDAAAKRRFVVEAQAASALDHPNICTIHEIGETPDGELYLVMACYDGETLKQKIARGPLAMAEALAVATQVAQGLSQAHDAGIIHRDIKPANLMVTPGGTVKILDFGLAKLAGAEGVTQTGTTVGTVAYMSPEQARAEEVDRRSDIWSLGVVLYEMLTGRPPFAGDNLLAISRAILEHDPRPLPGPAARAQGVVSRALSKAREGEVADEEGGYQLREVRGRHDGPPSLIRYPNRRSCRRAISPTMSAVSCKYRCELARPTCPRYVARAGKRALRSTSCWYHTNSLSTANPWRRSWSRSERPALWRGMSARASTWWNAVESAVWEYGRPAAVDKNGASCVREPR